ncbi:MAG: hypothetical protein J0I47_15175 [Sphingomonas sp.]|uniref:hypothetical protein n=1 Tax=Sphingomonas sp. TaxID=28214 RepID=UPI001AC8EE81|nr:hypothetical protein [Sphingomonas sp.]MBN8809560.1 hypothetical protein [Sphingomonas sp.]
MKIIAIAPLAAGLLLATGNPALGQTTAKTEVKSKVDVDNGVATRTTKVTHLTKRKTHRPKRILGVKVGHKTVTHKTVRETAVSSNGDHSTTVTTK